jgi:hypothetical protein
MGATAEGTFLVALFGNPIMNINYLSAWIIVDSTHFNCLLMADRMPMLTVPFQVASLLFLT